MSVTNDSAVTGLPMRIVGGLALLALIVGLLLGLLPALVFGVAGVVVALVLLRKAPALAVLGAGLNLAALGILFIVLIAFGD